jgi:hypothetical protein
MAIIQLVRHEYSLKTDRDSGEPTVFVLRALSLPEIADMKDLITSALAVSPQINSMMAAAEAENRGLTKNEIGTLSALPEFFAFVDRSRRFYATAARCGLTAVHNVLDDQGKMKDMKPEDFMQAADIEHLAEIGAEVWRITKERHRHAIGRAGRRARDGAAVLRLDLLINNAVRQAALAPGHSIHEP